MAVQFNFPPESYSAVYTDDGTANANVVGKCNLSDSCEVSGSPVGLVHTPPSSLFSCFHCAFQNGINFTRKEKRRKENHTANHKRRKCRSQTTKNLCSKAPADPEVSLRAKPNRPVYISRLHYTTKAEDIVEYVHQKTRYIPRVQLLESRRNVNFCVPGASTDCYLPMVMKEDFWPQNVVYRRFHGQVPLVTQHK